MGRNFSLSDLPPHMASQARRQMLDPTGRMPSVSFPAIKPVSLTPSASSKKIAEHQPSGKRRNRKIEDTIHNQIAEYLRMIEPQIDGFWWTSIENRFSGQWEGGRRKERGCRAGVPDIFTLYKGKSLWLEVKVPKTETTRQTEQSDVQKEVAAKIEYCGGSVKVVRTIDDVCNALQKHGVPIPF